MTTHHTARRRAAAAALCAAAALTPCAGAHAAPPPSETSAGTRPGEHAQPWRDATRSPAWRADALLRAMTMDEKVTLILATNDEDFDPLAHLGIPQMRRVDASGGLRGDTGVTAFPAPNALGATFDTALAERYGQAVGAEARAKGWNVVLGPTLDVDRNGLSGRAAEGYGEDTLVNGEMGAAVARGLESNDVIAMLKHFTVYNQESGPRETLAVDVSERALREVHYPAFEKAIREGGADSVMCAYPKVNGEFVCQNEELLADLKQDLGLEGYVATDFNPRTDPVAGINAGVDSQSLFPGTPREAFFDGRIPQERTEDAARRVLVALFDSGAYDNPLPTAIPDVVTTDEHQRLARETGAAASVLLKNSGALPLSKRDSVAVIGPAGSDAITGIEGSSYVDPGDFTTLAEAVREKAGAELTTVSQGSLGDVALPTVPASAFTAPGGEQGLQAEFFANPDFQGAPVATTTTPNVDFSGAAPVGGLPAQWSARFSGTITPTATGLARFSSLLSGSAKVTVGGETVFDGSRFIWDFFFAPQEYTLGGTVPLTAGEPVPITVEYSTREAGFFGPRLTLGWQPESLIPAAVEAAKEAETAVVVVNELTGEAVDRLGLRLPGDQDALIEAVAAVNPRTIVVLNTPGPVLMPWLDDVEGVVQSWYQGEAVGTATADVLYGDAEPGGRLPVTFPAAEGQGPTHDTGASVEYDEGIHVGYKWYDQQDEEPLFAFGHGLSYTTFEHRDLRAGSLDTRKGEHETASVRVRVRNTGQRAGSDVVQVYVGHLPTDAVDTPEKTLAGFAKVALRPGEKRDVRVELDRRALSYWDEDADRWVTPTGEVPVYVGRSAADVDLVGSMTVK
ncbi:beta-glucosidase [Kineococcus esterisolvens]|uniref:beta-glucosidase n=2 Tax=unclassified Kineococcus TaxID=2621656 RepID=UPI003D7E71B4